MAADERRVAEVTQVAEDFATATARVVELEGHVENYKDSLGGCHERKGFAQG